MKKTLGKEQVARSTKGKKAFAEPKNLTLTELLGGDILAQHGMSSDKDEREVCVRMFRNPKIYVGNLFCILGRKSPKHEWKWIIFSDEAAEAVVRCIGHCRTEAWTKAHERKKALPENKPSNEKAVTNP